jgi:hypothetical protein
VIAGIVDEEGRPIQRICGGVKAGGARGPIPDEANLVALISQDMQWRRESVIASTSAAERASSWPPLCRSLISNAETLIRRAVTVVLWPWNT